MKRSTRVTMRANSEEKRSGKEKVKSFLNAAQSKCGSKLKPGISLRLTTAKAITAKILEARMTISTARIEYPSASTITGPRHRTAPVATFMALQIPNRCRATGKAEIASNSMEVNK